MKTLKSLRTTDRANHGWLRRLVRPLVNIVEDWLVPSGISRRLFFCELNLLRLRLLISLKIGVYRLKYGSDFLVWCPDIHKTDYAFDTLGKLHKFFWPDDTLWPNIPSSATPQAGLEPRKRNGGEQ